MTHSSPRHLAAVALLLIGSGVLLSAQGIQLPSAPPKQFGASITPAFDGWFDNADGTHSLLVGYYNRNTSLEADIPIGPNNHFEPGPPDRGQPTTSSAAPLRHVRRHPSERGNQDDDGVVVAHLQRSDNVHPALHAHRLQPHADEVVGGESRSHFQRAAASAFLSGCASLPGTGDHDVEGVGSVRRQWERRSRSTCGSTTTRAIAPAEMLR